MVTLKMMTPTPWIKVYFGTTSSVLAVMYFVLNCLWIYFSSVYFHRTGTDVQEWKLRCAAHFNYTHLFQGPLAIFLLTACPYAVTQPTASKQSTKLKSEHWSQPGKLLICFILSWSSYDAFTALTLLVGYQEEHPACKNWVMRCWCGYLSGARCRLSAYGPADATASKTPSSASFKSRLVFPFWYRLTQVVLEKRLLSVHMCVYCHSKAFRWYLYVSMQHLWSYNLMALYKSIYYYYHY